MKEVIKYAFKLLSQASLVTGVALTAAGLQHSLGAWSLMLGGGLLGYYAAWADRRNHETTKEPK